MRSYGLIALSLLIVMVALFYPVKWIHRANKVEEPSIKKYYFMSLVMIVVIAVLNRFDFL